jgi:hypothetical protein
MLLLYCHHLAPPGTRAQALVLCPDCFLSEDLPLTSLRLHQATVMRGSM